MSIRIATLVLLLTLTGSAFEARADGTTSPRSSLNVELLGNGILGSVNGELGLDDHFALGVGITPFTIGNDLMLIPVRFSWLSDSTRGLYLGGGLTFLDTDSGSGAVSTLTWGVQKDFGTGDYIRLTFTHFGFFETVGADDEIARIPWPGVAVGGRF